MPGPLRLTERTDRRFRDADLWPTGRLVAELIRAQAVTAPLLSRRAAIARAADRMSRVFRNGGRIALAGAGTSGRLAVAEASECPPTFGTDPRRIVGLIAGGPRALRRAVEGAEDSRPGGARAVRKIALGAKDLLIGVSASAVTPFVAGALAEARRRGAATILVTCNPARRDLPPCDQVLAIPVGPEPLSGSTRMKAGTATKTLLNTLTTAAMIRANRAYGSRMVCVRIGSAKLRERAVRLVAELGRATRPKAARLLARCRGDVRTAVLVARGRTAGEAKMLLKRYQGNLRSAMSHEP